MSIATIFNIVLNIMLYAIILYIVNRNNKLHKDVEVYDELLKQQAQYIDELECDLEEWEYYDNYNH